MKTQTSNPLLIALTELSQEWRFVPINGNKQPLGREWQHSNLAIADFLQAEQDGNFSKLFYQPKDGSERQPIPFAWMKAIGILCGEPSGGVLCFDHDGHSCDPLIEKLSGMTLDEALPKTIAFHGGKDGHYQAMYKIPSVYWPAISSTKRLTGTKTWNEFKKKTEDEQIDLRWTGGQSVILGVHPESGSYRWVEGRSPSEVDVAECPTWIIELMLEDRAETPAVEPAQMAIASTGIAPQSTLSDREWALSYLGSIKNDDLDWYSWRDVLLALHKAGVSESEARHWSRESSKHSDSGFDEVWRYIDDKGRCIGIGTLGMLAKKNGWKSPKSDRVISTTNSDRPKTLKELDTETSTNTIEGKYKQLREQVAIALQREDPILREFSLEEISTNFRKSKDFIRKLVDELEQRRKPDKRQTDFDVHELLSMASDSTSYLIEDWVPRGESILLSAKPKVGKSLLAYDACFAVATGGQFLGKRSKKGKVLIIQVEEGDSEIRKRLYTRGFDQAEKGQVTIWTDWRFHRHGDRAKLEAALAENRYALVMVDSLRKIQSGSGIDENKAEFASAVYEMTDLCRSYGSSLLVIHHDNKDKEAQGTDAMAGTGALGGAAWGTWRLLRTDTSENSTRRHLSCIIRGGASSRHQIRLGEGEACGWGWEWEQEIGADPELHEYERRILSTLNANKRPMGMRDICETLGIDSTNRILYRPMNRLIERGRVVIQRSPDSSRKWLYTLPPSIPLEVCNSYIPTVPAGTPDCADETCADGDQLLPASTLPLETNTTDLLINNKDGGECTTSQESDHSTVQTGVPTQTLDTTELHRIRGIGGGSVQEPERSRFVEVNGVSQYRTDAKPVKTSITVDGFRVHVGDRILTAEGEGTLIRIDGGQAQIEGDSFVKWFYPSRLAYCKQVGVESDA